MDRFIFFCLFIFVILIKASLSTKLSQTLVLRRSTLKVTPESSFLFSNTTSRDLSSHFYVDVYMTTDYQDEDNSQNTRPMAIALYSSTTVLIAPKGICQHFLPYNCESFGCLEYPNNKTSASYPYFKADGYFGKAHVYLDFANWNLETKTILTTSCLDCKWTSYGEGTYGILGMGVAGSSWANFRSLESIFSVYLNPEDQTGEIAFYDDSTKAKDIPPVTLFADNHWHVLNIHSVQVGRSQIPTPQNLSLLFDINIDAIGFPLNIYKNLLKALNTEQEHIKCPSVTEILYKPTCDYSGNIMDLPIIYIHAGAGRQQIPIPPEIYIQGGFNNTQSQGSVVLNIKAVDSSLTDPRNYVRKDFANSIYLDSNFFGYYYAVFNGSSYTLNKNIILLYQAKHMKKEISNQWPIEKVIIGISISAILLIGILTVIIRKRNHKKRSNPPRVAEEQISSSNYQNIPERRDIVSSTLTPIENEDDLQESQPLIAKQGKSLGCMKTISSFIRPKKKITDNRQHPYTSLSMSSENEEIYCK